MTSSPAAWIACQLGAREHYAVARAMHRRGVLQALITDAWAPPDSSAWSRLPGETGQRLKERYSPDLANATVIDFTGSLVTHEASWRIRGLSGWPLVLARNRWFHSHSAHSVRQLQTPAIVFAHSYAALGAFKEARARGCVTVLGQIDPGPKHIETLRDVADRWPEFGPPLDEPPPNYFEAWREECGLADHIVANSEWSRDRLCAAGVPASKIAVVPLPFEGESPAPAFLRRYPAAFTADRPLRVLFVGSVATFKGVPSLLEAAERLRSEPIAFSFVGPIAATIPDRFRNDRRITFTGAVSRSEVMTHYREADVLVFPSHSDGFGMAQVEAQGWRLPVIASRSCGRVVADQVNGLLLPEVSADAIADALRRALDPRFLERLSTGTYEALSLEAFGDALQRVIDR